MALLLIGLDQRIGTGKLWRETLARHLPDLEVRIWPQAGNLADIHYLAFMHPDFDEHEGIQSLSGADVRVFGRGDLEAVLNASEAERRREARPRAITE